jgi:hypothetical protein
MMRIGVLYMGNERDRICGGGVITHYLTEALRALGHDTWRASGTQATDFSNVPDVDVLISEGVPASLMPPVLWRKSRRVVYWWLSNLYYDEATIARAPFDGIATNAAAATERLRAQGIAAWTIELAASEDFASAPPRREYTSMATYLGTYPHKDQAQLDALLTPATAVDFAIWGRGWERSSFRQWYRGILPLLDVGALYRSVRVVLAMTEERQRRMGMINNRIFEAIISGAVVISDPHPVLGSHELGRFVHFASTADEVRETLQRTERDPELRALAEEGQRCALARHTYRDRAAQFVEFFAQLHG